jgi:hypothetical protein
MVIWSSKYLGISWILHATCISSFVSSFLAISNSIPEAELGLDTTHLDLGLKEANDANCEDDAPIANS